MATSNVVCALLVLALSACAVAPDIAGSDPADCCWLPARAEFSQCARDAVDTWGDDEWAKYDDNRDGCVEVDCFAHEPILVCRAE